MDWLYVVIHRKATILDDNAKIVAREAGIR
jgi:hypothetical protein